MIWYIATGTITESFLEVLLKCKRSNFELTGCAVGKEICV